MDWQMVIIILLGIVGFYILCCFWAVIEGEWHKRKEAKKYRDWVNKRR